MGEKRTPSGFLLKQRAFLKLYLITLTEQERLYGLKLLDVLRQEFKPFGYQPNHSEVYKALHDLI
ncbi:MAG: Replication termination protein, partial [Geobacillus sp.]|nr:Replication termination protein [Geobacillus sp.]